MRTALARGQPSAESFKMALARRNMQYADVTITDIRQQFELAPALSEGKVDATVSWEPYNTTVLEKVPASYEVIRGGGHLSYVMVATTHAPTLESNPQIIRGVVAGLAEASQYTRKHRDEPVGVFVKRGPGPHPAGGEKAIPHLSYAPRNSPPVL